MPLHANIFIGTEATSGRWIQHRMPSTGKSYEMIDTLQDTHNTDAEIKICYAIVKEYAFRASMSADVEVDHAGSHSYRRGSRIKFWVPTCNLHFGVS